MSTKSKRRAARRINPDEIILGEIMGALLSAITFGALDTGESEEQGE
jgi:type IV secretory pathway ATPase VirB11/archaellum biosynthesis ATPase